MRRGVTVVRDQRSFTQLLDLLEGAVLLALRGAVENAKHPLPDRTVEPR
jgi:hypothetical protein